ncbi:MAG TPA: hypothetical protein VJI98_06480 [Candidatus Nanoarchaeia archaeon]|nr:hypothetical protein [Candidatus Nanoarchaeia archaeon]
MSNKDYVYFTAVDGFSTEQFYHPGRYHFFVDETYVSKNSVRFKECADGSLCTDTFWNFLKDNRIEPDVESDSEFHPNMIVVKGDIPIEGIVRLMINAEINPSKLLEIKRCLPSSLALYFKQGNSYQLI